jgi:PAS domain-containing protein
MSTTKGSRLIMPLRRLQESVPPEVARTLDLHAHEAGPIGVWLRAVQASTEACLLLDRDGRVLAASAPAGAVLGTTATRAVGAKFSDLVTAVDFTSGAAPEADPERSVPPLRALATGGLARGLLRLRSATSGELVTYDVVAVPLSGEAGVLAFFLAV